MNTSALSPVKSLAAIIEGELLVAQVLIRRSSLPGTYELRHVADRDVAEGRLRAVSEHDLRALAQFTAEGAFRPLKSAPTLRQGWRLLVSDEESLDVALHHLYPGAVADWFAAQSPAPPITSYRAFTGRQSGMYRVTATLDDAAAAQVIRVCCGEEMCLKRRLWTVNGLPPDEPARKSIIPCLEPCAILLESARKAARR